MKIILFANTYWYLYNFRLPLAQDLCARGDEVIFLSPPGEYASKLTELGFRWLEFPFSRRGMNPLAELGTILRLWSLYRRENPDLVHHFTIKCVLYGSTAAHLARIPRIINAITGLGYVFNAENRILGTIARLFYRLFLKNTQVIFQNPDDLETFTQAKLLRPEQAHLIRSSGVDLSRFTPQPENKNQPPLVILPARLLKDKGVLEFVAAARLLKQPRRRDHQDCFAHPRKFAQRGQRIAQILQAVAAQAQVERIVVERPPPPIAQVPLGVLFHCILNTGH